jgi:hypothetical protein
LPPLLIYGAGFAASISLSSSQSQHPLQAWVPGTKCSPATQLQCVAPIIKQGCCA